MIEWVSNKNLFKNPELIKTLRNTCHPLIRKYRQIIHSEVKIKIENTSHLEKFISNILI